MTQTTNNTTPKVLAYAVKVKTVGSFSKMIYLHRLLKQIDSGWPYIVDTEQNTKNELTVGLDPAYLVEDYNKSCTTDCVPTDLDTFLVYRPTNEDAAITKHYIETLINWIDNGTKEPRFKFSGTVAIIPITTKTHEEWYYNYREEKFTVNPTNTIEDDIDAGLEFGFIPANLPAPWVNEVEDMIADELVTDDDEVSDSVEVKV